MFIRVRARKVNEPDVGLQLSSSSATNELEPSPNELKPELFVQNSIRLQP